MTWFPDVLLARHARDAGGEIALVAGGRGLTWADLDARASAVAASLAGAGIAAGDRVALIGSEPTRMASRPSSASCARAPWRPRSRQG